MSDDRTELATKMLAAIRGQRMDYFRHHGLSPKIEGWVDLLEVADGVLAAGWRPPAQVIEGRDGIAAAPTGTVLRFPDGDIGSVDHGPHGEWTGPFTRVHLLLPGRGHVAVGDMSSKTLGVTVVWSPTEKAGTE